MRIVLFLVVIAAFGASCTGSDTPAPTPTRVATATPDPVDAEVDRVVTEIIGLKIAVLQWSLWSFQVRESRIVMVTPDEICDTLPIHSLRDDPLWPPAYKALEDKADVLCQAWRDLDVTPLAFATVVNRQLDPLIAAVDGDDTIAIEIAVRERADVVR